MTLLAFAEQTCFCSSPSRGCLSCGCNSWANYVSGGCLQTCPAAGPAPTALKRLGCCGAAERGLPTASSPADGNQAAGGFPQLGARLFGSCRGPQKREGWKRACQSTGVRTCSDCPANEVTVREALAVSKPPQSGDSLFSSTRHGT